MARNYIDYGIEKQNGIEYYGGYVVKKGKDYDTKEFIPCGLAVWVKQRTYNVDKKAYRILLEFPEKIGGQMKECPYTKEDTYQSLWEKGVDVSRDTFPVFEGWVQKQIREIDAAYEHENVGWDDMQNITGATGKITPYFKHYTASVIDNKISHYTGSLAIEPKGSFEAWLNGINKYVIGYTPLEFMVTAGLTSVLVGYMSLVFPNFSYRNLVFHLAGRSSIGKTTACQLAVSTAGCPKPVYGKTSLMDSWNHTSNDFYSSMAGNYGLVKCYDEIAMRKFRDFDTVMYNTFQGFEKGRMNPTATGSVIPRSWSNVILSTGEHSIWEYIHKDGADGIMQRCYEFSAPLIYVNKDGINNPQEVFWTPSAACANAIASFTSENYGYPSIRLAEYILERQNDIGDMYDQCRLYYTAKRKKVKDDGYSDRRGDFIGLVLLTAWLIRDGLNIQVDWDKLADFILLNEMKQISQHLRAYNLILEYAQTSPNFLRGNLPDNKVRDNIAGKIDLVNYTYNNKKVVQEIRMNSGMVKDYLGKKGHTNTASIFKSLKEEGYLIGDADHNSVKRPSFFNPSMQERQCVFRVFES